MEKFEINKFKLLKYFTCLTVLILRFKKGQIVLFLLPKALKLRSSKFYDDILYNKETFIL